MVYILEGPKYTHKKHQNQLQKRRLNDSNHKQKKSQYTPLWTCSI